MKYHLHVLFADISNLLFPRTCVLCGTLDVDVCSSCIHTLSQEASAEPSLTSTIRSCFAYKDERVRQIIWLLKYRSARFLASACAECIYEHLVEDMNELALFSNFTEPLLVPIPLSKKRLRARGYNQSELIARELVRCSSYCTLRNDVLSKVRETPPQMSIKNKKERLTNIVGCFAVANSKCVKGRNIILIDDVTTTGATLREAEKVLREAGARSVIAYTFAH
ncbi:MAG: phosphoribosyltransferase family protein [Candidatus Paceibacterota bacterium]